MYKSSAHILSLILAVIFISCAGRENKQAPEATTTESNSSPEMATVTPDTLSTATRSSLESLHYETALQINMAKLAMDNSNNTEVKNLAKTIVDQQTELNNKLRAIAAEKNLQFQSTINPALQSTLEIYSAKKGNEFNTEYLDWVIKSTEASLEKYENEGAGTELKEVEQYLKNARPILIQHHDAAIALQEK